jgi:hypothetical protein
VAHDRGERGGGQQDKNQYVVKVGKEAQPGRLAFFSGKALGPKVFKRSAASAALRPLAWLFLRQHRINRLLICAAWRDIP